VPEPVTSSNEVPEKVVVLPVLKLNDRVGFPVPGDMRV
jgi:hypothetical protein